MTENKAMCKINHVYYFQFVLVKVLN